MTIQWFPGHMAKARREVTEKLQLIDVVFELVDARLPLSSRNPMIDEVIKNKPRIILLNKADMADTQVTRQWLTYFRNKGMTVLDINAQEGNGLKQLVSTAKQLLQEKFAKMAAKGIKNPRAIRALIVGIPNVGKSTLINRLAGKNIAKTGDRPGVTKAQQWIKMGKEMELLDTPGILWPKFEDMEVGYKLAASGAIKDTILNRYDIAMYTIRFLQQSYPKFLQERYEVDATMDADKLFIAIGKRRNCFSAGGEIDSDKISELLLREVRSMKLGAISFEKPEREIEILED